LLTVGFAEPNGIPPTVGTAEASGYPLKGWRWKSLNLIPRKRRHLANIRSSGQQHHQPINSHGHAGGAEWLAFKIG